MYDENRKNQENRNGFQTMSGQFCPSAEFKKMSIVRTNKPGNKDNLFPAYPDDPSSSTCANMQNPAGLIRISGFHWD
jgi:hypothetical protein